MFLRKTYLTLRKTHVTLVFLEKRHFSLHFGKTSCHFPRFPGENLRFFGCCCCCPEKIDVTLVVAVVVVAVVVLLLIIILLLVVVVSLSIFKVIIVSLLY